MDNYNIKQFRFWCQKVLPLVYDDSLSYMELLCKVVNYLNHVIEDVNGIPEYIQSLLADDKLKDILSGLLNELREQIASINEHDNETATADRKIGDWLWLDGKLARIIKDMDAGDRYVEGSNFEYKDIEKLFKEIYTSLKTIDMIAQTGTFNSVTTDTLTATNSITATEGTLNNLSVTNDVSVDGDVTVSNDLNVNGKASVNSLDVTGDAKVTGKIEYEAPSTHNALFNKIVFQDHEGNDYNILTDNNFDFDGAEKPALDKKSSFYELYGEDGLSIRENNASLGKIRIMTLNMPMRELLNQGIGAYQDKLLDEAKLTIKSGANILCTQESAQLGEYTYDSIFSNSYYPYTYFGNNNKISLRNSVSTAINPYQYGVGIMSDIKADSSVQANYAIYADNVEPRGYIKNVYTIHNKKVSVYNTHLGLSSEERATQINALASILSNDTSDIIFVCGDFNINYIDSASDFTPILLQGFTALNTNMPTFPNTSPVSALDNIFVKGFYENVSIGTFQTPTTTPYDHNGFYVDIKF